MTTARKKLGKQTESRRKYDREYKAAIRAKNPGKYLDYMRKWREKNREALREYNREYQRARRAKQKATFTNYDLGVTMTRSEFVANFPVPRLADAVIRQFGGWESFTESAQDVANHGIDGGFHGFIYYSDTCKFAARNRSLIAELAEQQASDLGESVLAMVAGFNCLRGDVTESEVGRVLFSARGGDSDARLLIENALAWYAGEEVCRAYADSLES